MFNVPFRYLRHFSKVASVSTLVEFGINPERVVVKCHLQAPYSGHVQFYLECDSEVPIPGDLAIGNGVAFYGFAEDYESEESEESENDAPPAESLKPEKGSPPQNGAPECVLCMTDAAVVTFVHGHTGHTCACVSCARTLLQKRSALTRFEQHSQRGRELNCPGCSLDFKRAIRNYA